MDPADKTDVHLGGDWIASSAVTFIIIVGLWLERALIQQSILCTGTLILTALFSRSTSPIRIVAKLSLPFILPLLVIHGVLNPQFPQTFELPLHIPFRQAGFAWGLDIALRIVTLFGLATMWTHVDRDKLISDLVTLKLPLPVLLLAAQTTAIVSIIDRRSHAILAAQQARGINIGPRFRSRVAALPKLLIPLFVTAITDADARAQIMVTRGLGSGRIAAWTDLRLHLDVYLFSLLATALVIGTALAPP
jgi:energy-coupling factor transporter transmembrane protein EcfT